MNVIFVAPFMTTMARGIERCVYEIGTRLAVRGHRVHILYWPGPRPWPYGPIPPNLYLHRVPPSRYYQNYVAGLVYPLYFRRLRPDIVNVFYSWQGEDLAHLLWQDKRPASVLNVHFPAQEVPHRYAQLATSRALRRASAVVACSHYVAAGVRDLLKRDPITIHNGVDVDSFAAPDPAGKAALRQRLGLAEGPTVYCTVGALEERKGVGHALDALAALQQRGQDFYYLVVGEGRFRSQIEERVAAYGLHDRVKLVGLQADPRPFYQVADVFVFLSRGEAAPLAPLEAMSSALPVVAAQQPPLDEFLPADGTIFIDEQSPPAVADVLADLAADPARRQAMGAFNRDYARRCYSWERVVDHYEEVYRRIIMKRCTDASSAEAQ